MMMVGHNDRVKVIRVYWSKYLLVAILFILILLIMVSNTMPTLHSLPAVHNSKTAAIVGNYCYYAI